MVTVSMKVTRILGVTAALLLSILANDVRAQVYQGRELVKAELIADRSAIVPGKPFTVGLLLRMAPGWHTYWKFSGDAGLPTELKWKLPPGWKVGELQWPIPLKMKDPGDIQTYGYADEVLLMQEITPPASAGASPVQLTADANWLVCERLCIPGSASLHLDLPVSDTSSVANAELFDRCRRLLPKKWPGPDAAEVKWKRTDNDLSLYLTSRKLTSYPTVDFFPLPEPKVIVGHPEVESRSGDQINFKIPLESAPKDVSSIDGLVVFAHSADGSDREAWTLNVSQPVAVARTEPAQGLLTFLLFGFIGGFILNLMPCVLPVISLKIFGFVQQAGQSRRKILRSGLAFTAGIFTWFMGLALVLIALKSAGHQITWAFQFTNPYFVLFMSVVVLVFALNLFGVFEISLPQSATRGLLGATASEGDAASFFQGVFATVLATPCTAPFLGTALGFAFTQSAAVILAMFVAIAAGMALPYLLLCAQPAWLRFLPKPGPWMVRIKQFMGFLLLATLLFLLYVLGAQRGLDALIWASCFLLVVSLACWMKGAFITPVASTRARAIAAVLITMLLIASGAYFIGERFRSAKPGALQTLATGDWQPFTPELLQTELNQGHVVFVDFTAAWCLTCKFNEASVLESSAVREAFQRHGVTKMKADWTNGDPAITKLLQQFGRPGVPLYVLYPGKSGEPVVFPELLTQSIVLEKLETISRTIASQ
jgi:thiol:disulfide interchange protein